MYAVEFKGGTTAYLITATRFKVNNKLGVVIFKKGLKSVALFKLSMIQGIHKMRDENDFRDFGEAKHLSLI